MIRLLVLALTLGFGTIGPFEAVFADVVTVSVTVVDDALVPVEDVVLRIQTTQHDAHAITNASGQASLQIECPPEMESLDIQVVGAGVIASISENEKLRLIRRGLDLAKRVAFHPYTPLMLNPPQSDYAITITGLPARQVWGRLVDSQGTPVMAMVATKWANGAALSNSDGTFELRGIPENQDLTLFVRKSGFVSISPHLIPWSEISPEGQIGDVVDTVPAESDASPVIRLKNIVPWRDSHREPLAWGVTLIAADSGIVYSNISQPPLDELDRGVLLDNVLLIKSGTYYVAPGFFCASREQIALFEALQSGQDLSGTSLMRFTITAGSSETIEVDLFATDAAIHEVLLD